MYANEKRGVGSYSIYIYNLKLEALNNALYKVSNQNDR